MRGSKAKKIRKEIYTDGDSKKKTHQRIQQGQIVADDKRQAYQKAKKEAT